MKNFYLPLIVIGIVCVLLIALFIASQSTANADYKVNSAEDAMRYLSGFGWETASEPSSVRTVQIPAQFSKSYDDYNSLQLKQGFDLTQYRSRAVTVYTFKLCNHPDSDNVFANVMVCDGIVIGGDLVSYDINGFLTGFGGSYVKK